MAYRCPKNQPPMDNLAALIGLETPYYDEKKHAEASTLKSVSATLSSRVRTSTVATTHYIRFRQIKTPEGF